MRVLTSCRSRVQPRGASLVLGLLGAVLLPGLAGEQPALAGGPLLVGGTFAPAGAPFRWNTNNATPVMYTTDRGGLGALTDVQTNTLVSDAFLVWQNVPTANATFQKTVSPADLGQDLTGSNIMAFLNTFEDCQQASAFSNAIIFDSDGSVTEALFGGGSSTTVLGFAGAVCVNSSGFFTRGEAVLNGRFVDGQPNPSDLSLNKYREVFVHEFGHLIGLDHSQINVEVLDPAQRTPDNLFGLPLMFPFLLGSTPARVDQGFPPLAPDDIAWVSRLYPETANNPPSQVPFATAFGIISGSILFSDGLTHAQGINVIARQVDDPLTPQNDSRRNAVSAVSGFLFTGNPGQSVTAKYLPCTLSDSRCPASGFFDDNSGGSPFGSREVILIGFYEIPGLAPADYTVEVESVNPAFANGSSVGPLNPPIPNPGTNEFWNMAEANNDMTTASDPIAVMANTTVSGRDIILNGTPPRFDSFESAHLWLLEPMPVWIRRINLLADLVVG